MGYLCRAYKKHYLKKHNAPAAQNVQDKHQYAPIPLNEILLNPNLLNTDPTNNGYRQNLIILKTSVVIHWFFLCYLKFIINEKLLP